MSLLLSVIYRPHGSVFGEYLADYVLDFGEVVYVLPGEGLSSSPLPQDGELTEQDKENERKDYNPPRPVNTVPEFGGEENKASVYDVDDEGVIHLQSPV